MVDRFGQIFEARAGSLAGPVAGSATGGNQGFSQLCCFLGDHSTEPPTEAAQASMIWLLAWLADRHQINLEPGATVSFVSRGSNRWEAGATVTTSTIAGHRDMSQTACPGDACYELLDTRFRPEAELAAGAQATTTTTLPPTTEPPSTSTTASSTTAPSTTAQSSTEPPTIVRSTESTARATSTAAVDDDAMAASDQAATQPSSLLTNSLAVVGIGAILAAGSALAIRRRSPNHDSHDPPVP